MLRTITATLYGRTRWTISGWDGHWAISRGDGAYELTGEAVAQYVALACSSGCVVLEVVR